MARRLGPVWSNTGAGKEYTLADPWHSREHSVVDLGEDEFTIGRPHPMIDATLRNDRLLKEAADPAVAVILFDVILGVGAHADPAGAIAAALREARAVVRWPITFVASVCGTDRDPQPYSAQVEHLTRAGVLVLPSNAAAAEVAAQIAQRCSEGRQN